jgi:hypothetical protein
VVDWTVHPARAAMSSMSLFLLLALGLASGIGVDSLPWWRMAGFVALAVCHVFMAGGGPSAGRCGRSAPP